MCLQILIRLALQHLGACQFIIRQMLGPTFDGFVPGSENDSCQFSVETSLLLIGT
jgi:hypothetical protein